MKKLVLISALVLFVASFSYATYSISANTTPVEMTDDEPKAKEEKTEKKDEACCKKAEDKSCSKKEDASCTKKEE